jgi:hypothetical protein
VNPSLALPDAQWYFVGILKPFAEFLVVPGAPVSLALAVLTWLLEREQPHSCPFKPLTPDSRSLCYPLYIGPSISRRSSVFLKMLTKCPKLELPACVR